MSLFERICKKTEACPSDMVIILGEIAFKEVIKEFPPQLPGQGSFRPQYEINGVLLIQGKNIPPDYAEVYQKSKTTPEEEKIIAKVRKIGYGEVTVKVKDGKPVLVTESKTTRLD